MNNGIKTKAIIAVLAVVAVVIAALPNTPQTASPSSVKRLNANLVNQHGTQVKFADIVGKRVTVLNFIYTDCTTACPVVSAIFEKLQNRLGNKLQHDLRLVSLSINPVRDTPEKLKSYAEHFHAQPEWVWLTGEKTQVDTLLKELGVYSADYTNHTPVILLGDSVSGAWTRLDGFSSPEAIAAKIDELLATHHE